MNIIDKEIILKIFKLREEGKSYNEISSILNISSASVCKYLKMNLKEINNIFEKKIDLKIDEIINYYDKCKNIKKTAEYFNTYTQKIKKILEENNKLIKNKTQYEIALEKKENILNLYKTGITIKDISIKLNINNHIISKILKENNIKINQYNKEIDIDKNIQKEIIEMYSKQNISGIQISKKVNLSIYTIYKILKNNNIHIRNDKEKNLIYKVNENYFEKIDSEHKAYWLGFIYADGYITSKQKYGSQNFGITLSSKDRLHLMKLNIDLQSTYPINDYCYNTSYKENTSYSRLLICNQKIVNDLIIHGCFEHKTNILQAPKIDEELIPHFIRGYLDGDGCITNYINNGYIRYKVLFLGTKNILDFINDFLEKKLNFRIQKYYKRKSNQTVESLELSSNIRSKNFLDLIYKNASIYLDRKYNRYLELCELMNSRAYQE